jgi:uncharacterized protein YkwD
MRLARSLIGLILMAPLLASTPSFGRPPPVEEEEYEDVVEEWVNPVPEHRSLQAFRTQVMSDHNRARASVSAPPLVWDDRLAADAANHAERLAQTRIFAHSTQLAGEGENLWMGTRLAYSYASMTGAWVDERRDYKNGRFPNLSMTGSWHDVGHYTQIIWAGTRSVGCAMSSNETNEYMVCRYFPAGNVWGQDPLSVAADETFPHHNVIMASKR